MMQAKGCGYAGATANGPSRLPVIQGSQRDIQQSWRNTMQWSSPSCATIADRIKLLHAYGVRIWCVYMVYMHVNHWTQQIYTAVW